MTAATSARFQPLRVARIERETADAVAITLTPAPQMAERFRFLPGQYLTFRRIVNGQEIRRSYSICASLGEGALRVGIKRVPGGAFSTWAVEALREGDVLEAMAPEGRFGLYGGPWAHLPDAAAPPRTILGIACGSGITPVLSVLASVLEAEPGSRAVLLYGNRSAADVMFRGRLEELKDRYLSRFALVHVLSREKHELAALHGRLDGARIAGLLPGLLDPARLDAAFLCGPDGLAEAARAALVGLGVPAERIQAEHFGAGAGAGERRTVPSALPEAAPAGTAEITLDGVTRTVPVASGETVLEAGLRAGMDLPWSCRGGMCCTCRAKMTQGTVAMALNYSLQPWELEAGYVLTCQSRPTSSVVALDYDTA